MRFVELKSTDGTSVFINPDQAKVLTVSETNTLVWFDNGHQVLVVGDPKKVASQLSR